MSVVAAGLWGGMASAYFQTQAPGVRPKALGEAFTAIADDANALMYNPAGCAQAGAWELSGMYAAVFEGLDAGLYTGGTEHAGFNLIQAAVPLPQTQGGLGMAWSRLFSAFYQENIAALGYGQTLGPVRLGAAIKGMRWEVGSNEFVESSELAAQRFRQAWTLDLGFLANPWPRENIRLGASVQNVLPAEVGFEDRQTVPAVYRLGAAYTLPCPWPWMNALGLSAEAVWRSNRPDFKFGSEVWLGNRQAAVRAGINREEASCGLGFQFRRPEAPLGVTLDYAFSYSFELAATSGSHWLGLSLDWANAFIQPQPAPGATCVVPVSSTATASAVGGVESAKTNTVASESDAALMQSEAFKEFLAFRDFMSRRQAAAPAANPGTPPSGSAPPARVAVEPSLGSYPADRQKQVIVGFEQSLLTDAANFREAHNQALVFQKYLEQKTGVPIQCREFNHYEELDRAFRRGELDAAISTQGLFKLLYQERLAEPRLTAQIRGRDFQSACLLVRKDGDIHQVRQLQGKRLGYLAMEDLEGLNRHFFNDDPKFKPEAFFKELKKIKQARAGLLGLMLKDVDALVGYDYMLKIADDLAREQNLPDPVACLAQVSAIPNTPLFIRKTLLPEKRAAWEALETALLQAGRDKDGEAFLSFFHFDCFSRFKEKKYRAYFLQE